MDFYTIVRTEHLNQYGYLFGGNMLKWVDEYAYIAALTNFPGCRFVTRGMDAASFTKSVNNGAVLAFKVTLTRKGTSSASYHVDVTSTDMNSSVPVPVFSINVTMCAVTENGDKAVLPDPINV